MKIWNDKCRKSPLCQKQLFITPPKNKVRWPKPARVVSVVPWNLWLGNG